MRHINEFNRFAKTYGEYNIIQREVAKTLLLSVKNEPKTIIDLGCGSGTVYDAINWKIKRYIAIDLSEKMLILHPKNSDVEFIHADFDDSSLYEKLKKEDAEYLLSSSSLQWSQDIGQLFIRLNALDIPFSLALFTSGTFKTMHQTAAVQSPLSSANEIISLSDRYLKANTRIETYTLAFDSKKEMFSYLKKSGVSGVKKQLEYTETKKLITQYPLDYLEFEVVFINN